MEKNIAKSGRLTELDALRGIAAFGVLLYHYSHSYGFRLKVDALPQFDFMIGESGVALFFIISGFVIQWTLVRTKKPIDFVISRFARLYPTFWISLLLTTLSVLIFGLPFVHISLVQFLGNFTMVPIFLRIQSIDSVYWTLAIEMAFYALMFLVYITGNLKRIDILAWLFLLGSVVYKLIYKHFEPIENLHIHIKLIAQMPLFVAGIVFFQISSKGYSINRIAIIIASYFGIIYTLDLGVYRVNYYWHISAIAVYYIIFFAVLQKKANWLNVKPLLWLGKISYPLYLLHYNIGFVVIYHLNKLGVILEIGVLIAIAVSLLLAQLVNIWVERKLSTYVRNMLQLFIAPKNN